MKEGGKEGGRGGKEREVKEDKEGRMKGTS